MSHSNQSDFDSRLARLRPTQTSDPKPDLRLNRPAISRQDSTTGYIAMLGRLNLVMRILVPAVLAAWAGHEMALTATQKIAARVAQEAQFVIDGLPPVTAQHASSDAKPAGVATLAGSVSE